jgi:N6-L-threonylcarbamoyladenine synthase
VALRTPPPALCTDNGAMIAVLGSEVVSRGGRPSAETVAANSSLPVSTILL